MPIRRASASDAGAVFSLLEQLAASFVPERDAFDETFATAVRPESDDFILVAHDDSGAVTGYAFTTVSRLLYTNGPSAQLQELVVDGARRRERIGTALVAATEAECRAAGVRQLTVASRRAAGFYEGLGYRSTADFLKRTFE